MRVLLVNAPWASIEAPSLGLSILRRTARECLPGAEVHVLHANLDYVDWITEQFDFGLIDYNYYALNSYFLGCGDWVFSSALYGDPAWRLAEFKDRFGEHMTEEEMAMNVRLHELAIPFADELSDRILALAPDVVGFTSTFQQNTAALGLARMVKRKDPAIVTIFGGANCDGSQGEAMHRNFGFVDYVLRGESEQSFPQFLRVLAGEGDFAAVPGLCWRPAAGGSRSNPMRTSPLPPGAIASPDYEGYLERLEASRAATWLDPQLAIEGSRGCWWGEKHHCTFCGLNGSVMDYRSKSPERFYEEIVALAERYQVLDFIVVDNILDMGYFGTVLPRLAEAGYDIRAHYEVKANLRLEQLRLLAAAGIVQVQPGIESLSSRVLKIMDKGVTGCQNVRFLRDAQSVGLSVNWNYLYGFPGETDTDYDTVIAQMPALHHLEPNFGTSRIAVERFAPYFQRPELGFAELRPDRQYAMIYDLPEAELFDFAYVFDAPKRGISEATEKRLAAATATWLDAYPASTLSHCDLGESIVLVSGREHFDWRVLELTDPLEVAAFRLIEQPRTVRYLARELTATGHAGASEQAVAALLDQWRKLGIVYHDHDSYIHVAPVATNQELVRLDIRLPLGGQTAVKERPEPAGSSSWH
jgi:ribosomal peptide maturation radical SAM protein 1